MLPTTPEYFYVLVALFFVFWLVRSKPFAVWLIFGVNLVFCARWGWIYLALIPAAATADFFIARALAQRRWLLWLSIAINLGLILFCRYRFLALSLSFYAFQALTYTIDIYRGDAKPIPSYLTYISSVTFFPTLAAGPITRVAALAPQWKWKGKLLSPEEGGRALFLIGLGLFKKFLIADYLANNLVNRVFDLPTLYSGGDVLIAVYAYAFQLYYDFSGYSDIAIGSALLLGIKLPANFNLPYRATDIADFWKRWHITFSNWLRDYLYFSLPGKRTRVMPYVSLVITMAAGGLWHGFTWTFLIWGLLHGFALAIFRLIQATQADRKAPTRFPARLAAGLLTFHFVLFTWIFFRAANVDTAMKILGQIGSMKFSFDNATPAFLAVLIVAAAAHFVPKSWYDFGSLQFVRTPAVLQAAALALLLVAIRLVSTAGAAPFIYSKF
jgi:D-alanyl-lipoteichoic acid acyltransferase DltB (MBOAT superfamily)